MLLAPGTEIAYATVESRIAGNFTGWDGRAVLTLENGQRWQIANGGNYSTPALPSPQVKITPAALGGFWMTLEGVAMRVKVLPLGAKYRPLVNRFKTTGGMPGARSGNVQKSTNVGVTWAGAAVGPGQSATDLMKKGTVLG